MGTCDTCRHWAPSTEAHRTEYAMTCESPKWLRGYLVDAVPADGVLVENDEGWAVLTGPKFGCVHWEAPER